VSSVMSCVVCGQRPKTGAGVFDEDTKQWHAVIHANSRLMLAAVNAGWQVSEIAAVMGLSRHAASKRVQAARREVGADDLAGLAIPAPPPRPVPVSPLAILRTPVETRDWLSAPEAMALAGISFRTLTGWRRHGLLPNTRWLNRARRFTPAATSSGSLPRRTQAAAQIMPPCLSRSRLLASRASPAARCRLPAALLRCAPADRRRRRACPPWRGRADQGARFRGSA
jgi:hypothetical protein